MLRHICFCCALMSALLFSSETQAQDFRVQVAAYPDSMPSAYFRERQVKDIIVSRDQLGIYRYFASKTFNTREEAEVLLRELAAKGFPNSTIIDLAEQRLLCGTDCPYFRPGRMFVKEEGEKAVFFDFGRYSLNPEGKSTLDEVAQTLRANPKYTLQIFGHTDAIGSAEANVKLATNRARAVRNYLVEKGIRADRMFVKVFGESRPVADNVDRSSSDEGVDLPENRKMNRRVALLFLDENGKIVGKTNAPK
jgi:outer membrane protein OmpA-like peptidoglycan-associated protein